MKTLPFTIILLTEEKLQFVMLGLEFVLASPVSTHKAPSGEYLQNLSQKVEKSDLKKENDRSELDAQVKSDVNVSPVLWHLSVESKVHSCEYKELKL